MRNYQNSRSSLYHPSLSVRFAAPLSSSRKFDAKNPRAALIADRMLYRHFAATKSTALFLTRLENRQRSISPISPDSSRNDLLFILKVEGPCEKWSRIVNNRGDVGGILRDTRQFFSSDIKTFYSNRTSVTVAGTRLLATRQWQCASGCMGTEIKQHLSNMCSWDVLTATILHSSLALRHILHFFSFAISGPCVLPSRMPRCFALLFHLFTDVTA